MTDTIIGWQDALQRLIEGNERFVDDQGIDRLDNASRRKELISGQRPYACVLSCSDSRVVPEFAFDAGLGELFIVRVAGNVPNMGSIGSIEFAVSLGINLIVVLGHENCAAVKSALESVNGGPNVNHLLGFINEAITPGAELVQAVQENARRTTKELFERSDILREKKSDPLFKIVPAYYHLRSGRVEILT